MAIDSAKKRYSVLNFGRQSLLPLPIPDGTIHDGDRYHFLSLYYGIAIDPTVVLLQSRWADRMEGRVVGTYHVRAGLYNRRNR